MQVCVKYLKQLLEEMRETHIPALFHVEEITQPQGHSTSGSHERYKSQERLRMGKRMGLHKKIQRMDYCKWHCFGRRIIRH